MRINKLLAERLGISRRKADDFLVANNILVNGVPAVQGQDITDTDVVTINGQQLPTKNDNTYILLNKPVGYVCSRDGQGSSTIYDLLPAKYHHLNPVGRLDKDSSGLLLLTNDGQLHQQLTHPSHQKLKVYQVTLNKPLSPQDETTLQQGVQLKDGISKLKVTKTSLKNSYLVAMHEGRNRQIRRTFNALGYKITSLNRTQFGDYNLDNIDTGKWQKLANR